VGSTPTAGINNRRSADKPMTKQQAAVEAGRQMAEELCGVARLCGCDEPECAVFELLSYLKAIEEFSAEKDKLFARLVRKHEAVWNARGGAEVVLKQASNKIRASKLTDPLVVKYRTVLNAGLKDGQYRT
jgi:hypothetical protein